MFTIKGDTTLSFSSRVVSPLLIIHAPKWYVSLARPEHEILLREILLLYCVHLTDGMADFNFNFTFTFTVTWALKLATNTAP